MPQHAELPPPNLFRSFWMGGFEGANQKLCSGERVDMLGVTQHDRQMVEDYRLLRSQGIGAARESLPWPQIDRGGSYDFSPLASVLEASQATGVQVILSLCHYGWPDDVDVMSPAFVDRFARYCRAVAGFVADHTDEVPFYNPINEISFLAWAAGDVGFIFPCLQARGVGLKEQLVRATIAGCEAIWEVDPRARIVNVDPMIQVIAPAGRPDLARQAVVHHSAQFDAWDWLGGWDRPQLGGDPRYLDIIGVNYYHDNQWELERDRLSWEDRLASGDPRWLSFSQHLEATYRRYLRPIFIAETSHFGIGRGPWIRRIAEEVVQARKNGVPVEGICLYPILDRPDWHDASRWHNSGLWDLERIENDDENGELRRVLNPQYAADLRWAQILLAQNGCASPQPVETSEMPGDPHISSNGGSEDVPNEG